MKPRERVLAVVNRQVPDRPPLFATLTPQVAEKMSKQLGVPYEAPLDSMLSTRISHMALLTALGNDCVGVAACAPPSSPTYQHEDGTLVNEWGMMFRPVGLYDEFAGYPLAGAETVHDIESYPFPDPFAEGRYEAARKAIETYGEEYAIVGDLETAIFETAWYLVGMEKFLVDLAMDAPYVPALLDRILEYHLEVGKQLISLGVDIVWAGDDFGTQNGLLMSPELWRRHFKPRIRLMFDEFRKCNPEIKLAWHSCGAVGLLIPEFIELGLDILNPIQPLAAGMDPEKLKSAYGEALVFFGGIDIQRLLPFGNPESIKAEVSRISSILGKNGGYIIAPAHNIQDDTPEENILAFFEAVRELSPCDSGSG